MEAAVLNVVSTINSYLSNYVLLILLIGTGLFFTIRTRGVQFRCFGEGWKKMFGEFSLSGGDRGGAMSSFQAVATAVAAQVGTGNIVGACGAILIGGPGAIFWMWIIALLGMATNYAEATLAQKTRVVDSDGTVHGGPAYYITTAFKGGGGRFLAGFFAVAVVIALGFIGPMVQSNSIGETMNHAFGMPTWVIGLFIAVFAGFVFIGNLHRLASVTEKLVPIMAVLYIAGSVVVLIMNGAHLGEAFGLIFSCAFNPSAGLGGAFFGIWAAITQGAKRGLFSNEAGMGSTPHAHALADVKDPHDQGVVAMIGVFIDTIVVVTMTALVVISVLYTGDGPLATAYENAGRYDTVAEFVAAEGDAIVDGYTLNSAGELVDADGTAVLTDADMKDPAALAGAIGISKTNMAQIAFGAFMTENGGAIFICICLLFFAFSTILSWNLFAKLNVQYLFRKRNAKVPVIVFALIAAVFTFVGTVLQNDIVWELQDMFNQLMVLPNAIALIALSGFVVKCSLARGKKTDEINSMEI
ncbi:MAG: alanine:cation symporter family protein [Eggerthellaceae bacterium]|nr:alanine:cation symporter family protein [Eggerthellaceae bacterium]